ncbi:MAG TPA: helix-turn-helix domain-containing protein, partial [Micromonosporaceae bacterium]|nr:helix-turn-helix domain-containing protein [Micromonosporaceae bacterium]
MGCVIFLPMAPEKGRASRADFAALLRDVRLATGLTQEELAAKSGVGVRTVRDLERGRAARPQRTTVGLLATAMGLEGEDRARFMAASRAPGVVGWDSAGPTDGPTGGSGAPPDRPPTLALPAPTPLIGRDAEVETLVDLLTPADSGGRRPRDPGPRVVTLVGLAGVGKSSLGIAVLHRLLPQFPGGVAGIAVTDRAEEADLLAAVASVFGVGRAADLPERLRAPALLMIDAVEQSDAVSDAVRWLRRRAPRLRLLLSGRRPLGLAGEREFPVEPLEVPPESAPGGLAEVARYPAAALFLARLAEVRREPVTEAEAAALTTLVRRLGGVPLALELAAARGRVLDAGELLDRYGDRLLDLGAVDDADPNLGLRAAVAGSYR